MSHHDLPFLSIRGMVTGRSHPRVVCVQFANWYLTVFIVHRIRKAVFDLMNRGFLMNRFSLFLSARRCAALSGAARSTSEAVSGRQPLVRRPDLFSLLSAMPCVQAD